MPTGGGGVPMPGTGAGFPMPRSAVPFPGMDDLPAPVSDLPAPVGRTDDSVVHPFHGQTSARPAPQPQQQPMGLDSGVLDFIDRAAEQAGAGRGPSQVRIRKRSGKVVGPFEEEAVLRMLRGHELMGSEEASTDEGMTWKPLSQFPAFADEIAALMATALGGLGEDLPAPVGHSDLPAPSFTAAIPGPAASFDGDGLPEVPAAGSVRQRPAKPKAPFPVRTALALGGVVVLVTTGLVTQLLLPDVGAFGYKILLKSAPKPVPERRAPPPKPVAPPAWDSDSVEALLDEDTAAGYLEAITKLDPQAAAGSAPAALALARARSTLAYLDQVEDQVEPALAAAEQAAKSSARAAAPFKALALLAKGEVDNALTAAAASSGKSLPKLKDADLAERQTESFIQAAHGFALLAKDPQDKEAMQRFDWALQAWPHSAVASLGQFRAVQAADDERTARAYLERIIELYPDNIRARLELGRNLVTTHDDKLLKQATEHLQYVTTVSGGKGTSLQRARAHQGLSEVAVAQKDFATALEEIKNASAEVPDNPDLRARHGELALRMRDWPAARQVFDDILTQTPAFEPAIVGSARAKMGATDVLGAYKQLDDALKVAPNSALLTHWFGEATLALGKTADGMALFQKAQKLDPARALPVVAQARVLMANRKVAESLKVLEPARGTVDPSEDHLILAAMGEVYLAKGSIPQAYKVLQEALKKEPNNAEARAMYGRALRLSGKTRAAANELARALKEDPRNARILAENGSFQDAQGDYDRAVEFFQQALAVAPKDADLFVRLGAAIFRKGDAAGAMDQLKQAQALAPSNPDVYYWLGLATRKSDPDRAKQLFKQGQELSPQDGRFDHELGRSVGAEGAVLEAVDYMRAAVRKDPKNAEAYFEMGKYLAEQTRYADAREQYILASELLPKRGSIHLAIAETYERAGQYDQARKEYAKAIKKDPNLSEAHCKMGDVLRLDQKYKNAVTEYEACTRLNGKHKAAWRWLGFSLLAVGGKPNQRKAVVAFRKHLEVNPDDPQNVDVEDAMAELPGGGGRR